MILKKIETNKIPLKLLLEADPSESNINSYLNNSLAFAAIIKGEIVGVCIVTSPLNNKVEILNIAVYSSYQQKRVGSKLLVFVLTELKKMGVNRAELGTGSFGYQLTFYQRLGFRVDSIVKNHFLDQYSEAIWENGIQHKDMLRLFIDLT